MHLNSHAIHARCSEATDGAPRPSYLLYLLAESGGGHNPTAEVRVRGGVACAEMLVLKYGEVLLMGRVPVERSQ